MFLKISQYPQIGALRNFAIFTETHLYWSLFLVPATLLNRNFNTGFNIPVNKAKFLRAGFFTEHLWWLFFYGRKIIQLNEYTHQWLKKSFVFQLCFFIGCLSLLFFISFLNVSNRTNWKVLLSKCLTKLTSKNTSFLFQHQNVNKSQIDIFIWITFRYSFMIGLTFLASIFVKIHLGKYRVNLGLQKNLMNNCRKKLFK